MAFLMLLLVFSFFFSSRRRHTRYIGDWSSDVCSSDLDAPWLAAAALIIASNFVARDSSPLRAFDTIGLTIVFAVAFLSIHGVGLRGIQAWHYVRACFDAALSAWLGVFPLVGRDVTWSELPRGGRL